MITITNLTKTFDEIRAVDNITLTIGEGGIFGLVGTNGAGKSTLMRLLCGIYRPDEGEILIDGEPVYENIPVKQKVFYISDEWHFYPNATPKEMIDYYKAFYPAFREDRAYQILDDFGLERTRRIRTFSKGMRRQTALILGLSSGAKYLFMDETFDGLDPVMRQAAKSLLAQNLLDEGQTPVIASHNLRELEDICDHIGLLHKGGILLSRDLIELRAGIHRIQCVLKEGMKIRDLTDLDMLHAESRGKVVLLTVRGEKDEVAKIMERYEPVFYEIMPLSLEEIFISETEVAGYDIKSILF